MGIAVVLTALELEYKAIRRCLHHLQVRPHPSGTLFEVGHLPGGIGMAAIAMTGEGNIGAAILAERAIAMFQPHVMLCTGVAGSLRRDIALGDIVVATKVYALHSGRIHGDGFMARPRAWHASHELEQVAKLAARTGTWTGLLPHAAAQLPPAVHFKPVVSGEVVLNGRDMATADRLRAVYDDAVAVDMESAGITHAAHLNRSLPVLAIRGISDHASTAKYASDAAGWQHTAASHAAAFTAAILLLTLRWQLPDNRPAPRPPVRLQPAVQPMRPALPTTCTEPDDTKRQHRARHCHYEPQAGSK